MDRLTLTENDELLVLAVFHGLLSKPYDELNSFLGTETIRRMYLLHQRLYNRYKGDTEECKD